MDNLSAMERNTAIRLRQIICGIFLILLGLSTRGHSQAREMIPPFAQKVYTGIYLMNIYDLNINEFSFYADFYIWFRWKGDRDPMNIEFVNAIEKWGFTVENFHDTTQLLQDGWNYNGMRVEGRFYHSFLLDRFPLDRHPLDIRIENIVFPKDSLVYLPDTSKTLFRKEFIVPGWEIQSARIDSHANFYNTNFGEPGRSGSTFNNFTFYLTIGRPFSYFTLKLMLPLLVVILASLGSLLIHPSYMDARTSLPIGGLLSCVFLQQSYSNALPDVGDMVLMDKVYLLSYILIAAIMLRIIIVGNVFAKGKSGNADRLCKRDRRLSFWFLLTYLFGNLLLILLA